MEQEFSISHSSEGVARFQVGCSARHDDFQHTCPLKTTSQTLEMMALQTKVVSAFQIKKSPWTGTPSRGMTGGHPSWRTGRSWPQPDAFEGMPHTVKGRRSVHCSPRGCQAGRLSSSMAREEQQRCPSYGQDEQNPRSPTRRHAISLERACGSRLAEKQVHEVDMS